MNKIQEARNGAKKWWLLIVLMLVIAGGIFFWFVPSPFRLGFEITDDLGGNIFPSAILSVATTDAQVIQPSDTMYVGNPKSTIALRIHKAGSFVFRHKFRQKLFALRRGKKLKRIGVYHTAVGKIFSKTPKRAYLAQHTASGDFFSLLKRKVAADIMQGKIPYGKQISKRHISGKLPQIARVSAQSIGG
jgi:hypothetical protein